MCLARHEILFLVVISNAIACAGSSSAPTHGALDVPASRVESGVDAGEASATTDVPTVDTAARPRDASIERVDVVADVPLFPPCGEPDGVCPGLIDGLGGASGRGDRCLPPSDEWSFSDTPAVIPDAGFVAVSLTETFPAGLRLGDRTQRSMYVNTNGNVSFERANVTVTPGPWERRAASEPFPPTIAPWWADIDTRGGGAPARNTICFAVERERVVVTWDNVGYHDRQDDHPCTFQLVLLPRGDGSNGDADVEFRYARCDWVQYVHPLEAAALSILPQAFLFPGSLTGSLTLPGSRTRSILALCASSNVGVPGVWRFRVRGGVIHNP